MAFSISGFVADCENAIGADNPPALIAEQLKALLVNCESIIDTLGKPVAAGVDKLYVSPALTVLNVVWSPRMTLYPHNHNTWSVIGVYCGREDNIFWRRLNGDSEGRIEAAGAKSIGAGEVARLGKNIIHSVVNPTAKYTGAIHVYGGDFFTIDRSEWDPETLVESPYDIDRNLKYFRDSNKHQ